MDAKQIFEPQETATQSNDAVAQLKVDHKRVETMFAKFGEIKEGVSEK